MKYGPTFEGEGIVRAKRLPPAEVSQETKTSGDEPVGILSHGHGKQRLQVTRTATKLWLR